VLVLLVLQVSVTVSDVVVENVDDVDDVDNEYNVDDVDNLF